MLVPTKLFSKFKAASRCSMHVFGVVGKQSHFGRVQQRVLLVLGDSLFVCTPDGDIQRSVRLQDIDEIFFDPSHRSLAIISVRTYDLLIVLTQETVCKTPSAEAVSSAPTLAQGEDIPDDTSCRLCCSPNTSKRSMRDSPVRTSQYSDSTFRSSVLGPTTSLFSDGVTATPLLSEQENARLPPPPPSFPPLGRAIAECALIYSRHSIRMTTPTSYGTLKPPQLRLEKPPTFRKNPPATLPATHIFPSFHLPEDHRVTDFDTISLPPPEPPHGGASNGGDSSAKSQPESSLQNLSPAASPVPNSGSERSSDKGDGNNDSLASKQAIKESTLQQPKVMEANEGSGKNASTISCLGQSSQAREVSTRNCSATVRMRQDPGDHGSVGPSTHVPHLQGEAAAVQASCSTTLSPNNAQAKFSVVHWNRASDEAATPQGPAVGKAAAADTVFNSPSSTSSSSEEGLATAASPAGPPLATSQSDGCALVSSSAWTKRSKDVAIHTQQQSSALVETPPIAQLESVQTSECCTGAMSDWRRASELEGKADHDAQWYRVQCELLLDENDALHFRVKAQEEEIAFWRRKFFGQSMRSESS